MVSRIALALLYPARLVAFVSEAPCSVDSVAALYISASGHDYAAVGLSARSSAFTARALAATVTSV